MLTLFVQIQRDGCELWIRKLVTSLHLRKFAKSVLTPC